MSDKPTEPSGTPDNVDRIHHLVRMMRKYDLTEIVLVEDVTRIRLRRRGHDVDVPHSAALPTTTSPMPSAPAPAVSTPAPASVEPHVTPSPQGVFIESPMVGTFYASGSPDSPPFVSVGAVVRPDTTVCVIEAMKVFTEIPAGVSGTIAEILVTDKQPVEFGQPLFRVEPA